MKKTFLIIVICLLVCGCTNINKSSLDKILTDSLNSELKFYNVRRNGYKYYVPKGLKVITRNDYNEIISDDTYKYYMFVDVLSYYNEINFDYIKKSDVYYSSVLKYKDNFGYLEIKSFDNDKYLIEIMYNYAKIEVMVEKSDINKSVAYSISVLSSIKYNDNVIKNILGDNKLKFNEEQFNIFETADTKSNYLNYVEKYDNYDDSEVHDNDFID